MLHLFLLICMIGVSIVIIQLLIASFWVFMDMIIDILNMGKKK